MLDLLDGVPSARTALEMMRSKPLPFPPEPFRFAGIQRSPGYTQETLNDHAEGRGA